MIAHLARRELQVTGRILGESQHEIHRAAGDVNVGAALAERQPREALLLVPVT